MLDSDPQLEGALIIGDYKEGNFLHYSLFENQNYIYIWNLRVTQSERGSGLAQSFLDELLVEAKKNNVNLIAGMFLPDLDARNAALGFYLRNGFNLDKNGVIRLSLKSEEES